MPQIKLYILSLRNLSRSIYQLIWSTSNHRCFKSFSNHVTEQELLPFLIKTENIHPKNFNLLKINTELFSQSELPPNMITRAITTNRPIDHNVDEMCSNQSMITEKINAQNSNQNTGSFFQSETQPTSVKINPTINNTETTENISPTEVKRSSIPTSSALIPGISKQLQVPPKTNRSILDIHNYPNTSEKIKSQDISSGVISHPFHVQNTATLAFFQTKKPKGVYE